MSRIATIGAMAVTVVAAPVHAQDAPVAATSSFLIARTGIRTDSPHVGTYRYLES